MMVRVVGAYCVEYDNHQLFCTLCIYRVYQMLVLTLTGPIATVSNLSETCAIMSMGSILIEYLHCNAKMIPVQHWYALYYAE